MKKATKKTTSTLDQEARFVEGAAVEISTDKGWTNGIVTEVHYVNAPDLGVIGYHYTVSYVPQWARNEKYGHKKGLTTCCGGAIRAL